ncbi:hypothetical protein MTR67_002813 [Solanum verrucosum]|uniref:Reverse transcriptase RNase H-like domain-containing protein n=1 Tax=Solanum verrucosum TaxID=315347 RepID=A0AAF0T9T2_SOLVR|nr:hypothetical protein MTR67_002813 [Solanum verrucosum]
MIFDASGVVLGQRKNKLFHPINYTSMTSNCALKNYKVTEQELLALVYGFEKFRAYLLSIKVVVHTNHAELRALMENREAKPQFIIWVLLLQEFYFEIKDRMQRENQVVDHLSRSELAAAIAGEVYIENTSSMNC